MGNRTAPLLVAALALLARDRDAAAWEVVVRQAGPACWRCCLAVCGDEAAAADALQETFLQIRDDAGQFRPRGGDGEGDAMRWLKRIATTTSLQLLRGRRRATQRDQAAAEEPSGRIATDPAACLIRTEELAILREVLAELAEPRRTVIALHHLQGVPLADIAADLGRPTGTVKTWMHRGMADLRARLAGRGIACSAVAIAGSLAAAQAQAAAATVPAAVTTDACAIIHAGGNAGIHALAITSTGTVPMAVKAALIIAAIASAVALPLAVSQEPVATPPMAATAVPQRMVPDDPAARTTRLVISDEPRQVFAGFGTSMRNCGFWTEKVPPSMHRELARLAWGDGGMRILRLWCDLKADVGEDGTVHLADFKRRYIDSGLIREACSAGCTTLLLAPTGIPKRLHLPQREAIVPTGAEPGANLAVGRKPEFRMISDADVERVMGWVGEAVATLRTTHGVAITATGMMNEPNAGDFIAVAQTPLAIRALRRALDGRGQQAVRIVAPEAASPDWAYEQRIEALRQDPVTWSAVTGLAWHSYNMALLPRQGAAGLAAGKELWMTEASSNGPEQDGNDRQAAISFAARVANDLANGATHWIWFLGYEGHDPRDDQTRLLRIFPERTPATWEALGKFRVMQDLCAAFPPGSRILAMGAEPGLKSWSYGRKPPLLATAARTPDGGWSLLATNCTAEGNPPAGAKGSFRIDNACLPAQAQRLVVTLPPTARSVSVRRRFSDLATPIDEILPVADRTCALVVRPLEMLTMRIRP